MLPFTFLARILSSHLSSDKHLTLLFTILEGADTASLRANIVITLGDLSVRFPNLVTPYASKISKRLRDRDIRVRFDLSPICILVVLS